MMKGCEVAEINGLSPPKSLKVWFVCAPTSLRRDNRYFCKFCLTNTCKQLNIIGTTSY